MADIQVGDNGRSIHKLLRGASRWQIYKLVTMVDQYKLLRGTSR